MVELLSKPQKISCRFRRVNFGLVKSHVPYVADLTRSQLREAVERHKDIDIQFQRLLVPEI